MSPRVTVLLAVKDGLPWLRDAIQSVLAQTYEDFELLVVDDGSTDGTGDAAEAYGDPRIRVLRNERNLGQVPSLNRGLRETRGEYVARLDADDVCLPARLERQVAVLDADPSVALVGTWLDVVDEDGRLWGKLRGHVGDFPGFLFAILSDRYPWAHPSVMFRRDVVLELGGYDESLAPSEDKDLFRRLAMARYDARSVDEPLVRYRRHDAQLSQEHSEVQLRHDHESQERFLADLAGPGSGHPRRLRLLLTTGEGDTAGLDALLEGASRQLGLSAAERARLESLLARRLARLGLAAGPGGHRALRWASRREPRAALLVPLLPAAPAVRAAGRSAKRVARSDALDGIRRRARRVRLLRRLYSGLD